MEIIRNTMQTNYINEEVRLSQEKKKTLENNKKSCQLLTQNLFKIIGKGKPYSGYISSYSSQYYTRCDEFDELKRVYQQYATFITEENDTNGTVNAITMAYVPHTSKVEIKLHNHVDGYEYEY